MANAWCIYPTDSIDPYSLAGTLHGCTSAVRYYEATSTGTVTV